MKPTLSSEANNRLAGQEVSRHLWTSKVHYRIHKIPPLVRVINYSQYVIILSSQKRLGLPPAHDPQVHYFKYCVPINFVSFHCALHFHPIWLPLFNHSVSVYWSEQITERFVIQYSTPSCTSELSPRHIIFKHNQSLESSILRSRTEMKESDASPFESDRPISHTLASRLCCIESSLWNLFVNLFIYSFVRSFVRSVTC